MGLDWGGVWFGETGAMCGEEQKETKGESGDGKWGNGEMGDRGSVKFFFRGKALGDWLYVYEGQMGVKRFLIWGARDGWDILEDRCGSIKADSFVP